MALGNTCGLGFVQPSLDSDYRRFSSLALRVGMQARIVGQRAYLCRIEHREKSAIPRNICTELKLLTHGKASKLTTVTAVPKHKKYPRFTGKSRL